MSKKWASEGLAKLEEGGSVGGEPGHEIRAPQATSYSRSWGHGSFHFWIPIICLPGSQDTDAAITSALIGQEVKVGGVALISLNKSLGPVAPPLFFPETSLHSGPQNTDTYCELFRVNEWTNWCRQSPVL